MIAADRKMIPPKKDEEKKDKGAKKKEPYEFLKWTNAQRGLISIGVVTGALYAIKTNRSIFGIIGFMWLGSIAGGGIGYLFKKEEK